jgi:hypothetical protein
MTVFSKRYHDRRQVGQENYSEPLIAYDVRARYMLVGTPSQLLMERINRLNNVAASYAQITLVGYQFSHSED